MAAVRPDVTRSRRALLRAAGCVGAVGLAGYAGLGGTSSSTSGGSTTDAPSNGSTTGRPAVSLAPVADGFVSPVDVAVGGGETFVADQVGVLHRLSGNAKTTALDLRESIVALSGYEERGLLGVALHPGFPDPPTAYVRYSAPRREGTPRGYDHTFVLSGFTWTGDAFDPGSERALLEIPEPQANHNGGSLAFGPDGYLYVGVGDGGGANDAGAGHVADWYAANAGGNGQDTDANRLGSVLRIDVDGRADGRPYAIPPDNPLPDSPYPEQYAWGFRNPWRLGFDGDALLVADVGQNLYEEVDRVVAGGNYGWNVREGRHCFSTASPSSPPATCPRETPDGTTLRDPVIEYGHGGSGVSGIAVVGGYVYRGDAVPTLDGEYVFGDWHANGRLFVATPGGDRWPTRVLPVDGLREYVLSFGRNAAGELLVCTSARGTLSGTTGRVSRLVPA